MLFPGERDGATSKSSEYVRISKPLVALSQCSVCLNHETVVAEIRIAL
jgi:hypothetical protein